MTPLLLFLLGCAAIYIGTVTAAFSALMRLSLRIMAERSRRDDALGPYLSDPRRLFVPARVLLSVISILATALVARVTGVDPKGLPVLVLSMFGIGLLCEHFVPLLIVRKDPERVLDVLLPSFTVVAQVLWPLTGALLRVGWSERAAAAPSDGTPPQSPDAPAGPDADAAIEEGQARQMLRSLVDFRETMVREVMTPRPDIVAIEAGVSLEQLQAVFREQQYSRIPVFAASLDHITGFVHVRDMFELAESQVTSRFWLVGFQWNSEASPNTRHPRAAGGEANSSVKPAAWQRALAQTTMTMRTVFTT